MYYLDNFYKTDGEIITVQPKQASKFAKEVSDDFNPLHDPENKRFCVPGDLLFAITLAKYGLSKKMVFKYTGMVGKEAKLIYPEKIASQFVLNDTKGKECLVADISGEVITDLSAIESFTKAYVAFSGHSFPHILVPLMKENNMMINPARPMVIYESMAFEFETLNLTSPTLALTSNNLDVNGKRGTVKINFNLLEQGEVVGKGSKSMVLSGLREYDEDKIQALIKKYDVFKSSYSVSS